MYNPTAGNWTLTESLARGRGNFAMILLPNGNVLAAGGLNPNQNGPLSSSYLNSAELYNPAAGTWTPRGSLATGRADLEMVVLPNGNVLALGGDNSGNEVSSSEVYDPTIGTWASTGSSTTPVTFFQMVSISA